MAMNVEITISGLSLVVLKSTQDAPEHPTAVDVIFPAVHQHRVLASYAPEGIVTKIEPQLVVDAQGNRIASLSMQSQVMSLSFGFSPETQHTVNWGAVGEEPQPGEESWLNWTTKLEYLGLMGFKMSSGKLPVGAHTRLTLPFGLLAAREMIQFEKKNVLWYYAAVDKKRALANQLVFSAKGVQHFKLQLKEGDLFYAHDNTTFRLSLSNDLAVVPDDYNSGVTELNHLGHLKGVGAISGTFRAPKAWGFGKVEDVVKTGKPICNQVVFVDKT